MGDSKQETNPKVLVAQGSTVVRDCVIQGEVTIGTRTVIHPTAQILAEKGPIIIGEGNIVEEKAKIINRREEPLVIGNHNTFEVGCVVEANAIGHHNTFECLSRVGPLVSVGSGCTVGARCNVSTEEVLPDNIVVYGANCDRKISVDNFRTSNPQIDFLSKVMVNYHYVIKPNRTKEGNAIGAE
ncbi:dynactin subunit 6 [Galendromus occidentalis]|uniref:Dynactin subunit 6 n=1 Tax=Galendromus occidentalis TaxID=34638 RepID=A0AAJ6VYW2_9ACAR|nr:dynactin subunit 6 [Galendromus occidentalis]